MAMTKEMYAEIVDRAACPKCGAPAGVLCESGSGKAATTPHRNRVKAASGDFTPDAPREVLVSDVEPEAAFAERLSAQSGEKRENLIQGVLMGIRLVRNSMLSASYGLTLEDIQDAFDRHIAEIIVDGGHRG